MKKTILFMLVLVCFILLSGCQSEVIIASQPVGYGLLDDDHVGKASFRFDSSIPNNPNQIQINVYRLPQIWGELDITTLDENNSNVVTYDQGVETQYYAKYILIGDLLFTCVIDESSSLNPIRYENEEGVLIQELLVTEEMAKWYVEQIDFRAAYIVDHERIEYSVYKSVFDTEANDYPFQILDSNPEVKMVNWTEENESFPSLDHLFVDYDSSLVNQLFDRVLSKAFDPEYKVGEIVNRKS